MRVVCDNCGATYRIPDTKLTREVNKATCRKCESPIVIRRNAPISSSQRSSAAAPDTESTQITTYEHLQERERQRQQAAAVTGVSGMDTARSSNSYEDPAPPTVVNPGMEAHSDETIPRASLSSSAPVPAPAPAPYRAAPPPAFGSPHIAPPPATGAPHIAPPPATGAPHVAPPPATGAHYPPPAAGHYDPSGDMSMVMMASFIAAFGALVLATSTSGSQTAAGLFITVWAASTSLFIVLTGDRGRREAKVVLALMLSMVIGGATAGGFHVLMGSSAPTSGTTFAATPPAPPPAPAVAAVEEEPAEEEPAEEEPAEEEPAEEEPAEEEPAKEEPPKAPSSSYPSSTTGSSSASSAPSTSTRSNTSSSSSSSSRSSGSSSSSSSAPASTGVQPTVLATMLNSNRGVKTCFIKYKQETGSLPSGTINTKIQIEPSGSVSSAYISGGTYAGSSLDSCLGSAIRQITFPPFSGSSKVYTFPFSL